MVVKDVVFSEDSREEIDDCNLESILTRKQVAILRELEFFARLYPHAVVLFKLSWVEIEKLDVAVEACHEIVSSRVQSQS